MKTIYVASPLLAGAILFSWPATARLDAQRPQLERLTVNLQTQGYQDTGRRWSGSLTQGQSSSHAVYLRRGVEYVFSATCDVDCSDVDLQLFSPGGILVAEDVLPDDVPQVAFTPRTSGTYRIGIRMHRCSIQPCGYSVSAVQW